MATHDYVIANASGAAVRQDINNALAAIVSNNSSATEPGTTYAFQFWFDTTNNILKIRNAANSAWIDWITTTATALLPDGTVGAPGLTFASETDSGLYRIAANTLGIATSGTERVEISDTGIIINEGGDDADVRIEGNSDANLVFIDAGNDRVGIGTSSPSEVLHVDSGSDINAAVFQASSASLAELQLIAGSDATDRIRLRSDTSNNFMIFNGDSESVRIDSSGNVGINTTSPSSKLHVYDGASGGTPNSNAKLTIEDNGNAYLNLLVPSAYTCGVYFGDNNDADVGYINYSHGTNSLAFGVNASERMRILSSGDLGVGTSSPSARLDVVGTANSEYMRVGGSSRPLRFSCSAQGAADNANHDIDVDSSAGSLSFSIGTNEAMRIDSSGRLLVGTSSSINNLLAGGVQIAGTSSDAYLTLTRYSTSAGSASGIILGRSKSGTLGTNTAVASGDTLGAISFSGANGSSFGHAAQIVAAVDGAVSGGGASDMPGRLVFSTSPDGSASPTERMRIASDGNVGIGTTSPATAISASAQGLSIAHSNVAFLSLENTDTSGKNYTLYTNQAGHLIFYDIDALSERMRINTSGLLMVNTTNTDMINATSGGGCVLSDGGIDAAASGEVVANFNRSNGDGTIVTFRSQGANEGSVSISGSTTSFNGGHLSRWSQLAAGAARTEILRGSVLSNLDEMCVWSHAAVDDVLYTADDELPEGVEVGDVKTAGRAAYTEANEQLNRMKVSDVEGDPNVAGVFQCWDDDDDTFTNDFFCAMTGDFVIRIAEGTTVARGDLLMSAGDGTAKPQDDDIIRSKTIAKVTSTVVSTTHADGSYCVPCVLMAC